MPEPEDIQPITATSETQHYEEQNIMRDTIKHHLANNYPLRRAMFKSIIYFSNATGRSNTIFRTLQTRLPPLGKKVPLPFCSFASHKIGILRWNF